MTFGKLFASQEPRTSTPGADVHERDDAGGRHMSSEYPTSR